MTIKLSVNLNAIAVLRNRRNLPWPNVVGMGRIALDASADGLTVHPRPDQRHIRFTDLPDIRRLIDDEFPNREFNIEGYPDQAFLDMAELYADQITLVPDSPQQSTSDHGWDFGRDSAFLKPVISRLKERSIRVIVFVNPVADGLEAAKDIGADGIEIYTGPYGDAYDSDEKQAKALEAVRIVAQRAKELKLLVNAGHDLTVSNLPPLVKRVPWLYETSIGHGLIADALEHGMRETVLRFKRALAI
ncbi:pyridoxine 5'-phosphate synthase [Bartonella sp. W8125]|uniref:pyridoxine 5'-phosphate synthase n=1 Tax=Bartonella TaxID=773 RepID=UPI0018DCB1E3|nr:pyridoxine 5'-phosphate synthase [Bartonella choladocola]MBI0140959.1 pyridoxine 5'-phosphate synthase [Bartonella choladocola]